VRIKISNEDKNYQILRFNFNLKDMDYINQKPLQSLQYYEDSLILNHLDKLQNKTEHELSQVEGLKNLPDITI